VSPLPRTVLRMFTDAPLAMLCMDGSHNEPRTLETEKYGHACRANMYHDYVPVRVKYIQEAIPTSTSSSQININKAFLTLIQNRHPTLKQSVLAA
jgi:hypothetical protein